MILANIIGAVKNKLEQTTWTLKVQAKDNIEVKGDKTISGIINAVTKTVKMVQGALSSIFPTNDSNYEDLCNFDSFISMNGQHDSEIVKNVIEKGSFRSVNKIKNPDIFVIELAKGGWQSDIENVLYRLKVCEGSTRLCKIFTPFGNMENLNLIKVEYKFSSEEGASLLVAKLTFQEVRGGYVGKPRYTLKSVASPNSTNTADSGRLATKK